MDNHTTHIRRIYSRPRKRGTATDPGKVSTCIQVGMRPETTRTLKTMLDPIAQATAAGAGLAGIGRINKLHRDTDRFSLVLDKALQLAERPTVQPRPNAFPGLDAFADMSQVFHRDLCGADYFGFQNDGLARFVICLFHAPLLFAGDLPELLFRALTAVGLKTTTQGKVFVAPMAQVSAAPDLARAAGGEIVFSDIHAHRWARDYRFRIFRFDDKIEIPLLVSENQISFLGSPASEEMTLVFAESQFDRNTPTQRVERNGIAFERIGALVEMNAGALKADSGDRSPLSNLTKLLHCLKRLAHGEDHIVNHLRTERCGLANHSVSQFVQCDTIPAAMFNIYRNYCVACIRISGLQQRQVGKLFWCYIKFDRGCMEHDANNVITSHQKCNIPTFSRRHNAECTLVDQA